MSDNTQTTLDDFAETLIQDKQYATLTPAMHDELKQDILHRVHDYLVAKTIEKLSDEQAKKLSELLDTNPSEQQVQDYIKQAVPDTPTFIGDTLFQFRQTYLGLA